MTVEVAIEVSNEEVRDILIANLSDVGFDAFEEDEAVLKGYIEEENFKEEELISLLKNYDLKYSKSTIKEKNWNEIWESDFSPVIVGDFCSIRADFHTPVTTVKHEIIITPKMSFGTGHHATTCLMVQEMENISFKNKNIADFGTGTGILSILAEKLGASDIWAIDNDDWSIENAKENIERNGCKRIQIEKKNSFVATEKFDIILANINRNVILQNFDGLAKGLKKNGLLLLSGLLTNDETAIISASQSPNFIHVKTVEKDNWISMLLSL